MFSKAVIALPLAAALLEQTSAFSFHRHLHNVEKRNEVVYHTVYHTVYVNADAGASPAETQGAFVADNHPANVVAAPTASSPDAPVKLQEAPLANAQQASQEAPQSTLATAVKPVSSSPSSATSNAGPLNFAKRGIAYNDPNMANSFKESCGERCGWAYNWGSSAGALSSRVNFVPLLWGDKEVHTQHWHDDAEKALKNGAKALLSFNEPDIGSQANMSPQQAAAAHAKYFAPYVGRAQIGAPAVSNSGQPGQGIAWLKDFMSACNSDSNCHVDFCPVHWYSPAQYSETLFEHLDKAKEACGGDKAVWLTEFAPTGSDDEVSKFMTDAIPRLEKLDYLHAYSYFMVAQPQLMSSGTSPNNIGSMYAALAN